MAGAEKRQHDIPRALKKLGFSPVGLKSMAKIGHLFEIHMYGLVDLEEVGVHEHSRCCNCMIIAVPSW